MDAAAIDAGRLTIERNPHDLTAVVREALAAHEAPAAAKSLELRSHSPSGAVVAVADRGRIAQVLSNLLGNAVKFTREGHVEVTLSATPAQARVEVSDTGVGLSDEQRARAFDRYWQARSGREGLGLGLAIAKGLVEAHGGEIGVMPRAPTGATFWFTLPLV
jgi:signal transduction histidine kinase